MLGRREGIVEEVVIMGVVKMCVFRRYMDIVKGIEVVSEG